MTGAPKRLPGNVNHLHQLVSVESRAQGIPPVRLQRWLTAMVITAVLDRIRDERNEPIFLIRGGVAMELRLKLRARATKDYDAVFRAAADHVIELLDRAIAEPWNDFTITRTAPEPIKTTKAVRLDLRLQYKGKSWGTTKLELAPVEGAAMGSEHDDLPPANVQALRVPPPAKAPALSLRYQVATKIHACTETFDDGSDNDRFRDIIDVLLLEDLLRDLGLGRVREACVDIFKLRNQHKWPPAITVYESWREPFTKLAHDIGFVPDDVGEAADLLTQLIGDIDAA
jgi:hypothetical protein